LVQAVLERFPGAEIVDVRAPAESSAEALNGAPGAPQIDGDLTDNDR